MGGEGGGNRLRLRSGRLLRMGEGWRWEGGRMAWWGVGLMSSLVLLVI